MLEGFDYGTTVGTTQVFTLPDDFFSKRYVVLNASGEGHRLVTIETYNNAIPQKFEYVNHLIDKALSPTRQHSFKALRKDTYCTVAVEEYVFDHPIGTTQPDYFGFSTDSTHAYLFVRKDITDPDRVIELFWHNMPRFKAPYKPEYYTAMRGYRYQRIYPVTPGKFDLTLDGQPDNILYYKWKLYVKSPTNPPPETELW
jgi:hypothetical protein